MRTIIVDHEYWKEYPRTGSFIYFSKDSKLLGDKSVLEGKSKELIDRMKNNDDFINGKAMYIFLPEGHFFTADDLDLPQVIQIVKSDMSSLEFFMSLTQEEE